MSEFEIATCVDKSQHGVDMTGSAGSGLSA